MEDFGKCVSGRYLKIAPRCKSDAAIGTSRGSRTLQNSLRYLKQLSEDRGHVTLARFLQSSTTMLRNPAAAA